MQPLQKDLKIFRFKNHAFGLDNQKYDYQLFRNKQRIANRLSDHEFGTASVMINKASVSMTLVKNISEVNFREMEEKDVYLVPVIVPKEETKDQYYEDLEWFSNMIHRINQKPSCEVCDNELSSDNPGRILKIQDRNRRREISVCNHCFSDPEYQRIMSESQIIEVTLNQ